MKNIIKKSATISLLTLGLFGTSAACTVATHNFKPYGIFAARTADICIPLEDSFKVYPAGLEFSGATPEQTKNTVKWINKYGYIVIEETNIGNVADDGVNEKGLAAHILYNGKEVAVDIDPNKPTMNSMQWIHYVLGNFSTVKEALKSLKEYNLHNFGFTINEQEASLPIHYKIEDASGDSAIVEFIDGKVYTYHDKAYTVMANEPNYSEQIKNLIDLTAADNKYSIDNLPGGASSLNRFARTAFSTTILPNKVKSKDEAVRDIYSVITSASVPYNNLGCSLLNNVKGGDPAADTWPTVWTSMTDLSSKTLYYTNTGIGNRVWVNLSELDLSKGQKAKSIALNNSSLVGDISDKLK